MISGVNISNSASITVSGNVVQVTAWPWVDQQTTPPQPHWSPTSITAWKYFTMQDGKMTGRIRPWEHPHLQAVCLIDASYEHSHPDNQPVPAWNCSCGIYAYSDKPSPSYYWDSDYGLAIAQVELSGTIIEHDSGYRAEKAKVIRWWSAADLDTLYERAVEHWRQGQISTAIEIVAFGNPEPTYISEPSPHIPRPIHSLVSLSPQWRGLHAGQWNQEPMGYSFSDT